MIVSRNIKWELILFYTWKSMVYFLLLSVFVYVLHVEFDLKSITVPFNAVATVGAALAIFLGFNNNSAYDRWWEARKIWGLLVNYSRAWGREVLTLAIEPGPDSEELARWRRSLIDRHIAFVHALRVFLRQHHSYNGSGDEVIESSNSYHDLREFLTEEEYEQTLRQRNPPNFLLLNQARELRAAYGRGWLSDFRFVQMQKTLTEFNNHQGMSERIKNTPFPRSYSYFSRVFVYLHGTMVPFAFIEELGAFNIPLSLVINFIFLALDRIGERTADPFENRADDTPLSSICLTIEENLKEMCGDTELPVKPQSTLGIIF